jgi:glycosyltransferase involved in cell wall biosynthesis
MLRWRPHIAHFYLPGPYLIGAPAAIAARVPIKIMSRRSLSHYQKNWPTAARMERWLHNHVDLLIGNSRAVVAELLSEGIPETKVRLIYNGIEPPDLPTRGEARRELGLAPDAFVGVAVANLIKYKGHQDLIKGLAQVAWQLPSPWRMLLVGRDEGLRPKLQSLASELGIASNIQFLGERSDILSLFAAADFSALSSHEEGFSNVILESMAAALPLVVTQVGGNPEAVLDEETGLVVPPKDPNELGRAIARLAGDPALRTRLGRAGRARVEQEFSLARCVRLHRELYDGLLKAERRTRKFGSKIQSKKIVQNRRLMLAYWGRYGGLPQLTLELGRASKRLGQLSDTTISVSAMNELVKEYEIFGEAIFKVKTYATPIGSLDPVALIKLRRAVWERLIEDGTRFFVSLMPHVWSPVVTPMLREAGIRHTVIIHDADPHLGDRTALINRWLLREAKLADRVVTLTRSVAERLIESNVVAEDKISVLFHPNLTYANDSIPNGQETSPLRLLFFGRILPYKGLKNFVSAVELLRGENLPLTVGIFGAGELSSERTRLEALDAEIVNRWISPDEIGGIFARHDVVVVAHTKASQSGVIAAAHGAGVPVVCTPVGGLVEQVVPDINGVVANDISPEALAGAIRRFEDDKTLLSRIRRNLNTTNKTRSVDRFLTELAEIAQGSAG